MAPLSTEYIEAMSVEEIRQVLHDLRVHQIELEMQNEDLRSKQMELDAARAHYFGIYDLAPVGYLSINEHGLIYDANLTAVNLLGVTRDSLVNQPISRFICKEDQDVYYLNREQIFKTGLPHTYELRIQKMDGAAFWASLKASVAQDANCTPKCFIELIDITQSRQLNEKLWESDQYFNALSGSGQALIWTSGTDKLCNYVNCCWLEFTGRTLEQEMGNGWIEGVHPDDRQLCSNVYLAAFDRWEKFKVVYRLRNHDGEYRWILDEGCPRYDSKNEFIGYIGHGLDISERKQIEEELHASLLKYKRLFESVQDVYFETNMAGVIQEVSPSVLTVYGFYREELIGKLVTDLPGTFYDKDQFWSMLQNNGKVINYEMEFTHKNETRYWGSISATLVFQSDGLAIIGSIRDVTARKKNEIDLQIKESAISSSLHGIAFVSRDGTIAYANPSFVNMWGYCAEKDVTDRSLNDFFQTDPPVFNIAAYLLGKVINGEEMTAVRKDRSMFAAQVSASLIRDVAGMPLCINVSVMDITVRKEREDIMLRQDKMSSLGVLSAGLAHELRNPLAVISSCAQFSLDNLSMGRLVTENLQMIYRNSQRASNLINDLLAFSRASDMKQQILNINDLLLKIKRMAILEMSTQSVVFEDQLEPDLPGVMGDEEKLGQVFLNIMINAIQAVEGKGIIIMKTVFHPNRCQVEAAVIDNGSGIPNEYRKRIFDPFFTSKKGGTGVGLSISLSIVQQHNGTIVAEPKTGGGTIMSVMLPAIFQRCVPKETNHVD